VVLLKGNQGATVSPHKDTPKLEDSRGRGTKDAIPALEAAKENEVKAIEILSKSTYAKQLMEQ
jgi:hypothetical protein